MAVRTVYYMIIRSITTTVSLLCFHLEFGLDVSKVNIRIVKCLEALVQCFYFFFLVKIKQNIIALVKFGNVYFFLHNFNDIRNHLS